MSKTTPEVNVTRRRQVSRTRLLSAIVVASTLAALATGLFVVHGRTTESADAVPAAPVVLSIATDEAVVKTLEQQGVAMKTIDPASEPELTSALAVDVATDSFGQLSGKEPSSAALARVTLNGVTSVGEDTRSTGKLLIADRLAWVVVFDDFRQQMLGPPTVDGKPYSPPEGTPLSYTGPLVIFIDATTNKFLHAETAFPHEG